MSPTRILFVAEAVTLAHVARPFVLAHALARTPGEYDIHFATDPRFDNVFPAHALTRWALRSIPSQQFVDALAKGSRLYDEPTLDAYLADDLRLLEQVKPDLVVGDFRLSLAVSAPVAGVPYLAITNAHWSPYATGGFPLPELPMVRYFGVGPSRALFRLARPLAFAHHAGPMNRLRRDHNLPELGSLQQVYTWSDETLYADTPSLVPTRAKPTNHHYIGPILWSPTIPKPGWWGEVPGDRPVAYVTMGSSGDAGRLQTILQGLGDLGLSAIVATAGKAPSTKATRNDYQAWLADYLPGMEACQRAALVVCNGGSATVYQALAAGKPVLGIADNMDQFLTMQYVVGAGAGLVLRSRSASVESVRAATHRLLKDPRFRARATHIAAEFEEYDAAERFRSIVEARLSAKGGAPR